MNSLIVAVISVSVSGSTVTGPISRPGAFSKFVLDKERNIYEVGAAYEGATNVWFSMLCAEPSNGETNRFVVKYEPKKKGEGKYFRQRFIVTAKRRELGARTSVSFDCEGGVHVVLNIKQVPYEEATFAVEFVTAPKHDARVEAAKKEAREIAEKACNDRVQGLRAALEEELETAFLSGLTKRYTAKESVSRGLNDALRSKSLGEIVVGAWGYVVFEVHNRTGGAVVIDSVQVLDENSAPLNGVRHHFASPHLGDGHKALGSVQFDLGQSKHVTLLICERGPRCVEVQDIRML